LAKEVSKNTYGKKAIYALLEQGILTDCFGQRILANFCRLFGRGNTYGKFGKGDICRQFGVGNNYRLFVTGDIYILFGTGYIITGCWAQGEFTDSLHRGYLLTVWHKV
jgi:hypothetical protein